VSVFQRLVERVDLRVPAYSSLRRTTTSAAILLALALATVACGSDDPEATTDPTESASVSATPTPTPTPTPTAEPLSAFEDRAPVKAARAWAVAKNKAINAGDKSMRALRPVATARGLAVTQKVAAGDLDHGYFLPGPDPFTPVNVRVRGAKATLSLCMLNSGWSVDRKTRKPVGKHKVGPVVFEMVRASGRWKFDNGFLGTGDCQGVEVQEVKW
jgi:hypothetical protein